MFCEVILPKRFPKKLGIFDYLIPKKLEKKAKTGQLVRVPFRSSETEGIILKIKSKAINSKKIKPISQIIRTNPVLTNHQIKLALWISKYYLVSAGTVIKAMIPALPSKKNLSRKQINPKYFKIKNTPLQLTILVKELLKKKQKCLFIPQNTLELAAVYQKLLGSAENWPVLLLVPEIKDIEKYYQLISLSARKKTVFLHAGLNKNQQNSIWKKIITGQAKIIIGTKLVIFQPFSKLKLIIVDNEDNRNHKQSDQNPRYHALKVTEELAKIHQAKLLISSSAPQVETFFRYKKSLIISSPKKSLQEEKEIKIVNLKNERKIQNYSVFSELLKNYVSQAIRSKEKIFLYLNKKGHTSSIFCVDCGKQFTCKTCQNSLTYHLKNNSLFCHFCNKKYPLPEKCPVCSGINFRFSGAGTEKAYQETKKLWPDITVSIIDHDHQMPPDGQIIIGTDFALSKIDLKQFQVIGLISLNSILSLPDFKATEKAWQKAKNLIFYARHQAKIIIQAYSPENPAIKCLTQKNLSCFYIPELKNRQLAQYPPYSEIIKLISTNNDKKIALKQATNLLPKIKKSGFKASLVTPLKPYFQNKWHFYIIVKLIGRAKIKSLEKLSRLIPDNWIIDRDPYDLL